MATRLVTVHLKCRLDKPAPRELPSRPWAVLFIYRPINSAPKLSVFRVDAPNADTALEQARRSVAKWPGAVEDIIGIAPFMHNTDQNRPSWFKSVVRRWAFGREATDHLTLGDEWLGVDFSG